MEVKVPGSQEEREMIAEYIRRGLTLKKQHNLVEAIVHPCIMYNHERGKSEIQCSALGLALIGKHLDVNKIYMEQQKYLISRGRSMSAQAEFCMQKLGCNNMQLLSHINNRFITDGRSAEQIAAELCNGYVQNT